MTKRYYVGFAEDGYLGRSDVLMGQGFPLSAEFVVKIRLSSVFQKNKKLIPLDGELNLFEIMTVGEFLPLFVVFSM